MTKFLPIDRRLLEPPAWVRRGACSHPISGAATRTANRPPSWRRPVPTRFSWRLQLPPMLDAVTTARKARSLMRQNRILAMIYNMFAIRIAVIALVTPLIAAILSGDDFSELQ